MKDSRADRLRKARLAAGFKSASLAARSLGVSPSTYIHHENGTRDFDEKAAAIYARRFHVTISWLLLGEGDMATPELIQERDDAIHLRLQEDQEYEEARSSLPSDEKKRLREERIRFDEKRVLEALREMILLPEISPTFRRGVPSPSHDWRRFVDLEEAVVHPIVARWGIPVHHVQYELGADPSRAIVFPIIGDANSPTLNHGDLTIIDTATDVLLADGLYLISDSTANAQVRRLQANMFSNPPSISISADGAPDSKITAPADSVTIVGKVVGRISRL